MKKSFAVFLLLTLTGCASTSVPVKTEWPSVPEGMTSSCPNLNKIDPNVSKLSDIVGNVSENYSLYYDCKAKVDDWLEWYNGQKKIHNGKSQ